MVYFWKSAEYVSQTNKAIQIVFHIVFCISVTFEWPISADIFAHWSNIACLPAGRIKHIETPIVEADNSISNCNSSLWKKLLNSIKNDLSINPTKTKDCVIDFTIKRTCNLITMIESLIEQVDFAKVWGCQCPMTHSYKDLTWNVHIHVIHQ